MYMPCNYYQPMQGSCSQSEQPAKSSLAEFFRALNLTGDVLQTALWHRPTQSHGLYSLSLTKST